MYGSALGNPDLDRYEDMLDQEYGEQEENACVESTYWELSAIPCGDLESPDRWRIYEYLEKPSDWEVRTRTHNFISYWGRALDDIEFVLVECELKETIIMNVFDMEEK